MKIVSVALLFLVGCSTASDPPIPLQSGDYVFTHRFAEHPTIESIRVNVRIAGSRIAVVNPVASAPFPAGLLSEGKLMWHSASQQWIIGRQEADRELRDVGGCSSGPEVVDLVKRVYWSC